MGIGVLIWDIATGKQVSKVPSANPVRSVSWSADGRRIAAVSFERDVVVWDVATSSELFTINAPWLTAVALSPDGNQVAWTSMYLVGSPSSPPCVHDLQRNVTIKLAGHRTGVYGLAWFADGKRLATTSFDHTV